MDGRRINATFTGGALAAFGYTILCALLLVLMIPGAWGAAALFGWLAANVRFADGTRVGFEGRPGRAWALFAAMIFVSFLPSAATFGMPDTGKKALVQLVLSVLIVPFVAALKLPLYRWTIGGLRLTPGGNPRFVATYPAYLGWSVLFSLSFLTIVGWAWVGVAMARWICRNIEADGYAVEFAGTGWGLLWRGFVWLLGSVCIIPLPWVWRSMYGWGVRNLVLVRRDIQGEYSSALV